MEVMTSEQQVVKKFLSKRAMLSFISYLDIDRFQIERSGDSWYVSYVATKSVVTIGKEDYTEVSL